MASHCENILIYLKYTKYQCPKYLWWIMTVMINIVSNERNKLFRLALKDLWKIECSKIFKFWQKIYIYIYVCIYSNINKSYIYIYMFLTGYITIPIPIMHYFATYTTAWEIQETLLWLLRKIAKSQNNIRTKASKIVFLFQH